MKKPPTLARKRLAYQRAFNGAGNSKPHLDGQIVLEDLRKLAKIDDGGIVVSPVQRMTDPFATCYRAGLRDVYLRIAKMLGLDESDVFETKEESPHEPIAPT